MKFRVIDTQRHDEHVADIEDADSLDEAKEAYFEAFWEGINIRRERFRFDKVENDNDV